jgi:gliding motility-associated-like protein
MLVVVQPVNDAPRVEHINPDPLVYNVGSQTVIVDDAVVVTDVDDDVLLLGEVGIKPEYYQAGADIIEFDETENIRGVFDPEEGILSLIGIASLEEYTTALRSVRYGFIADGDTTPVESKVLYYRLNDGKTESDFFERTIVMGEVIVLDIPNVFTPNDDLVNDTWKISASKEDSGEGAVIRVFNERGVKVFEATGLSSEWDGRMNGEFLPADIYYYTIDLNLSYRKSIFRGSVMIIR